MKHITRYNEGNILMIDDNRLNYLEIRPNSHEEWLKQRALGIGASECGKAIGCSKYGSAYSLFMDKIGKGNVVEENWAMRQGHIFEHTVAEEFQKATGLQVIGLTDTTKDDWLACSREYEFLRVSPDYLYYLQGKPRSVANRGLLECKTSVHHYTPDCLKDECLSWYCQVQYQMYVMGIKEAYLGFLCIDTLTGGDSWFEPIQYNEKFTLGSLIPALVELWQMHIAPARAALSNGNEEFAMTFAPELTSADDVSRRYPKSDPEKQISGDDIPDFYDRLAAYLQTRVTIKELEKQQSEFEDFCKLSMKDAESIVGSDKKPFVTFKSANPTMKFNSAKFKSECPDMYEQYCVEQPGTRRFLIK